MFELWRQCCVNFNYSSQQFCKSCVMHLLSEKPGWSIWLAEEKFYSWVLFISLYKREMRKSQQNKSLSQIPWSQSRAGERILASGSKQIPDLTSEKASAFCICCRVLSQLLLIPLLVIREQQVSTGWSVPIYPVAMVWNYRYWDLPWHSKQPTRQWGYFLLYSWCNF